MCHWESKMIERGDGEEEGEQETSKVSHRRMRKESSIESGRLKRQTHTQGGRNEGDGEGRKWEQEGAIDCRLCTCHTEKQASDKIKCHHLGRDWRVPWLISHEGHSGCQPPLPPPFIKIHHCPEWDSSGANTCKRNDSGGLEWASINHLYTEEKTVCCIQIFKW